MLAAVSPPPISEAKENWSFYCQVRQFRLVPICTSLLGLKADRARARFFSSFYPKCPVLLFRCLALPPSSCPNRNEGKQSRRRMKRHSSHQSHRLCQLEAIDSRGFCALLEDGWRVGGGGCWPSAGRSGGIWSVPGWEDRHRPVTVLHKAQSS
ncbi:hypothetical protein GQ54DRAFT_21358 [Martensiomyces pterosporus]|nr:hypothetical protein GQ54DRAFT_21358 [Martensiomyces pterosporus]